MEGMPCVCEWHGARLKAYRDAERFRSTHRECTRLVVGHSAERHAAHSLQAALRPDRVVLIDIAQKDDRVPAQMVLEAPPIAPNGILGLLTIHAQHVTHPVRQWHAPFPIARLMARRRRLEERGGGHRARVAKDELQPPGEHP